MRNKFWKLKESGNEADIQHLISETGVNAILANLLVQRGIRTARDLREYFSPDESGLHDPFLMKDMDIAVERLYKAVESKEKILVYGDYDVDGTTAVATVYSFLRDINSKTEYYIPDRYIEGYGVSYTCIDYAVKQGVTLFITLDCGIKAVDKVKYGKSKGIDFIICDHHFTGSDLPDAVAILNPKRPGCTYPFKHLSGCGVGFKLLQGYSSKYGIDKDKSMKALDLVAISIASDIVPITGENRVLATLGLKKLNNNPGIGVSTILSLAGLDDKLLSKNLRIDDIVFKIGPRINAAGRIESGNEAVELLIAKDPNKAKEIGLSINKHNNIRKSIDQVITAEARAIMLETPEFQSKNAIVLFNPEWHKGVIGIVASRLIEEFYKPTIILTESNGFISGSARSVEGFDLYSAIDACSDLLENFGGHTFAAGVTLKKENLNLFSKRFEQVVTNHIREDQKTQTIEIDSRIDFKDITLDFFETLKKFEPFGPDNTQPVFLTENVSDNGYIRTVGKNGEHLRLDLIQESIPFTSFSGIGFQLGKYCKNIRKGEFFDICYTLDENTFRGTTSIQIRIKDLHQHEIKTNKLL